MSAYIIYYSQFYEREIFYKAYTAYSGGRSIVLFVMNNQNQCTFFYMNLAQNAATHYNRSNPVCKMYKQYT